jgi:hypothetical protein
MVFNYRCQPRPKDVVRFYQACSFYRSVEFTAGMLQQRSA